MIQADRFLVGLALLLANGAFAGDERANYFNDPFLQATSGIADCPVPKGPEITKAQMTGEAHSRTDRGTSCYLAGRCRLPNSYLYDKEIIPRVKKAILASGRYAGTSVWAMGQRRWVWLRGCVRSKKESAALEQLVKDLDDVEAVINELVVRERPR
ncbi:MAG: BON domain-containing protein [Burkholderiales bacterium]